MNNILVCLFYSDNIEKSEGKNVQNAMVSFERLIILPITKL